MFTILSSSQLEFSRSPHWQDLYIFNLFMSLHAGRVITPFEFEYSRNLFLSVLFFNSIAFSQ